MKSSSVSGFERILLLLTCVCLLLTAVHALVFPRFINLDVGLYLEVGNKLLDGDRPYVDYEENNFPMIHALNVIPAGLGRITGLPPTVWVQVCTVALLIACIALTRRLLSGYAGRTVAEVGGFSLALVSFGLMVTLNWAQREHLFTLMFVPWLILRVLRRDDQPLGRGFSFAIGVMAGVGIAIKPHFAVIALLPEAVGLLTTRRWKVWTPEVLGVALVAGLHALYFALNPDVLSALILLLQRLSAAYQAYDSTTIGALLVSPVVLLNALLALSPVLLKMRGYRLHIAPPALMWALSAMTFGSLIAYILQQKGWAYHAIPFAVSNVMLVALLATEGIVAALERTPQRAIPRLRAAVVGFVAVLIVFQIFGGRAIGLTFERARTFDLAGYIETYSVPGDWVLFLDTIPNPTYPMLPYLNRRSASRYSFTQPFVLAYYGYEGLPYTDPAHVVPAHAQEMLESIGADITRHDPAMVIIRVGRCNSCSDDFPDLYDYLRVRGVIDAVILPAYDLLTVDAPFYIYVRR